MKRKYDSFSSMNIPEYYIVLANSIKENKTNDFVIISNEDGYNIESDDLALYFHHILNGCVKFVNNNIVSIEYDYNDTLYIIKLSYNNKLEIYKLSYIKK